MKGTPRRYLQLSWNHALQLDESIVQHKAIRFCHASGLHFEVAGVNQASFSEVGNFETPSFHDASISCQPLRVALLGLGTVAGGVYQQLARHPQDFQVVAIAVRNKEKALAAGAPAAILLDDAMEAVASDCDLVVELVGGIEEPRAMDPCRAYSGKARRDG